MSKTRSKGSVWSPETAYVYVRRQIEKARAPFRPVLESFATWLLEERGLAPQTAEMRLRSADLFLTAVTVQGTQTVEKTLAALDARGIESFFVEFGQSNTKANLHLMQSAIRLLLRFAAMRGWADSDLATAVPSLVSWRLSGLPRGLSDEQLARLLSSPWISGECPRRDRAILELLATYGVRREQVSALQLLDVEWRERRIVFAAHKQGKTIHHQLTGRVAQALAEYLSKERPESDCQYVFLRHHPPHQRLSPGAISAAVRVRMKRCGLPPNYPRVLRHTFATRLLRAGQPLKVIADLLGHRSLGAVAIYAKVDFPQLLEVAMEWPEVAP